MNDGDGAVATGDWERALVNYAEAARRAPQIVELPFWHAVALVNGGRTDEALPVFADVFRREPRWREAVGRLVRAGSCPRTRRDRADLPASLSPRPSAALHRCLTPNLPAGLPNTVSWIKNHLLTSTWLRVGKGRVNVSDTGFPWPA